VQDENKISSDELKKELETILNTVNTEDTEHECRRELDEALAFLRGLSDEVRKVLINSARQNSTGDSVLHTAVALSNDDAIKYLLDNGANAVIFNNSNETPLDIFLGTDEPQTTIGRASSEIQRLSSFTISFKDLTKLVQESETSKNLAKSLAECLSKQEEWISARHCLKIRELELLQELQEKHRRIQTSGSPTGSRLTWDEFINSPDVVSLIEKMMTQLCEAEIICPLKDFIAHALNFFLYASSLTNRQCSKKDSKDDRDRRRDTLKKDAAKFFGIL